MFSLDHFLEIQAVGLLMLLALSPLAILASNKYRTADGFCPPLGDVRDKSAVAVLVLVAAFAIGILTNRLVDDVISGLQLEGKESYKAAYQTICARGAPRSISPSCTVQTDSAVISLRVGEYDAALHYADARADFDRHASFMRVLRGAAAAALVLMLCMLWYDWHLAASKPPRAPGTGLRPRYPLGLYAAAGCSLLLCSVAYRSESRHQYKHICELATGVDECRGPVPPGEAHADREGRPEREKELFALMVEAAAVLTLVAVRHRIERRIAMLASEFEQHATLEHPDHNGGQDLPTRLLVR